jgi:hypothetical protein
VAYAILDEEDYATHSRYRWTANWDQAMKRYVAMRTEKIDRKSEKIYLHREILQLPRNPGRVTNRQAMFINGNSLDCRKCNLRVGDRGSAVMSRRRQNNAKTRFRGTGERVENGNHNGWYACFTYDNHLYRFRTIHGPQAEVHCAYLYNCCLDRLRDQYARRNVIPPNEMPSPEDQEKLRRIATAFLTQKGLLDANGNRARSTNNDSEPEGGEK